MVNDTESSGQIGERPRRGGTLDSRQVESFGRAPGVKATDSEGCDISGEVKFAAPPLAKD